MSGPPGDPSMILHTLHFFRSFFLTLHTLTAKLT